MRGKGSAIVVGGSIGGLAAAIALARNGIRTTVLESRDAFDGRGGLGVDYRLLCAVTGEDPEDALAYLHGHRRPTGFNALHNWLAEVAARVIGLDLRLGSDVTEVDQDDDFAYAATGSAEFEADVLIGADGGHGPARAAVDPDRASAGYSGYLTWRGWIADDAFPAGAAVGEATFVSGEQVLVARPLPGLTGRIPSKGLRAMGFAWHDPTRARLLEAHGCIRDGRILRGLEPELFPPDLAAKLAEQARRRWPAPWGAAVAECFEQGLVHGAPTGDQLPERLAHGRVALLGSAAYTRAPAIGHGDNASVDDALALRDSLAAGVLGSRGPAALTAYEGLRLAPARELAAASRRWGGAYTGSASVPGDPSPSMSNR
ncbi:FAD-dependent monooxygenase [Nocardia sp. NPDC005978]|uniref:FAD-dependent monooxygenase n=1 Tax=Nocardia sp. NPDC005978 TaxID=3156725 RepID=UPI0033A8B1C3